MRDLGGANHAVILSCVCDIGPWTPIMIATHMIRRRVGMVKAVLRLEFGIVSCFFDHNGGS